MPNSRPEPVGPPPPLPSNAEQHDPDVYEQVNAACDAYIDRQIAYAEWHRGKYDYEVDPLEILCNPFYHWSTCLLVEDKESQKPIALWPKPVQIRVARSILRDYYGNRPSRKIILKARREGVSTIVQALFFWLATTQTNQKALTIAHDDDTTKYLHGMAERYYALMPRPFRPMAKTAQSGRHLEFANPSKNIYDRQRNPGLDSSLRTVSLKNSGAGQGATKLHLSEVALWPAETGSKALSTVLQVVPLAGETIVVMESTARGVGNEFYDLWRRAELQMSGYDPIFIPWFDEPTNRLKPPIGWTPDALEEELAVEYGLDLDQLWWYRICLMDMCKGDEDVRHQEYPSSADEAFLSTGRPYFPARVCRAGQAAAEAQPPALCGDLAHADDIKGDTNNGKGWSVFVPSRRLPHVKIWEAPDHEREDYLIAADASGGNPLGDFHAAYVFKRSAPEIVASWYGKVDRDEYGTQLYRLGKLYAGVTLSYGRAKSGALIAVEITGGWGQVPVSRLKWMGYPRIYRRPFAEDVAMRERGDPYGWDSTTKTRPLALDELVRSIREGSLVCHDPELYRECLTFSYNEKGKPEAEVGHFDDRVMAAAIGVYLWGTEPRAHTAVAPEPRRALSVVTGY